jgi:transketolase
MTHQGPGDVSILKTLPGMQVCVPGTADEFESLLRQTYNNGAPTYIRTSVQQNDSSRSVRFGKLSIEREGKEGVVVAVGPMLERALAAAQGMDLTVLYITTVVPFDGETFKRIFAPASPNVILVEPYYAGGLVPEIARALQAIPARIKSIGVPHRILDRYGPPERIDQAVGLDVEGIRAQITSLFDASS